MFDGMAGARRHLGRTASEAQWVRRRNVAFTVVCWLVIAGVILWAASHIIHALLLLLMACLLAYALFPLVDRLHRWMPRPLALVIVYLGLLALIGTFGYFVVTTAIKEFTLLVDQARILLTPGPNGEASPLIQELQHLGFSSDQISAASDSVVATLQRWTTQVVPLLTGLLNGVLDTVLVLVMSIYLLIDGERVSRWATSHTPLSYRGRITSFMGTLQRVVGGYIRGQLLLSALIGFLVGGGMYFFHVPYAILLGVMAFFLEFIPIIGTLVSGAICVLLALTQGWLIALGVLLYFTIVHVIEGDIVGPRIVGHAIGLHPVVSIAALVAGGELFGIWGALLASPLAGLVQAVLVDLWVEWRKLHPDEFEAAETGDGSPAAALAASAANALVEPAAQQAQAFSEDEGGYPRDHASDAPLGRPPGQT
jgi:predicted PurR-regulated permease PerM